MPIKPPATTYLYLLDHALQQEIGIAFTITGIVRKSFLNTLYEARKLGNNPAYGELIFFSPAAPHENEIFICKKSVSLDDATPL
jgi:hypothetical protein